MRYARRSIIVATFVLVAAVIAGPYVFTPALAKNPLSVAIGPKTVKLVLPTGHCALDERQPSDARSIAQLRGVFSNANHLLTAFADCRELPEWRTGKLPLLANFGQYITPLRSMLIDIPLPRATLVSQICTSLQNTDKAKQEKLKADSGKRIESQIDGVKISEQTFLTTIENDQNACYFSTQQKANTPQGNVVIHGISAFTLIKGRVVQINLYSSRKGDDVVNDLLARQKQNITKLVAAQ